MGLNVFIWSKGAVLSPYSGPGELEKENGPDCMEHISVSGRRLELHMFFSESRDVCWTAQPSDQCHLKNQQTHYTHPVNFTRQTAPYANLVSEAASLIIMINAVFLSLMS